MIERIIGLMASTEVLDWSTARWTVAQDVPSRLVAEIGSLPSPYGKPITWPDLNLIMGLPVVVNPELPEGYVVLQHD